MFSTTKEFEEFLKDIFNKNKDLYFLQQSFQGCDMAIAMIEGIASTTQLSLLLLSRMSNIKEEVNTPQELCHKLQNEAMVPLISKTVETVDKVKDLMLSGFAVIYIQGTDCFLGIGLQDFPGSSVPEVSSEGNIKGSKLGFSQNLRVNMALLRHLVKSCELCFEISTCGEITNTEIMLCYHKSTAPQELVTRITKQLQYAKLPMVFDSAYLAPFFNLQKLFSFFSPCGYSEHPTTAAAKICEGKVILLVAGSPFALIYPYFFSENFQCLDDYAGRPYFATFIRILKYLSFFIATLLPAFFISVANFTPELFPKELLYKVAFAEQSTPFPLFVEAVLVTLLLEIVREAGLRLPKQIGGSVSLVAALIVGDAAIKIGILSAPIVIVIAFATLAAFVVPSLYEPVIILRIVFICAAGFGGPVLLCAVFAIMLFNICGLRSFGIPFTEPLLPPTPDAIKDGAVLSGYKDNKHTFNIQDYIGKR